jgi:hypothetical protein
MNEEEDRLAAFVITPGWLQTDMGNAGARAFGYEEAPMTIEESVGAMVPLIEKSTKESHGGRLWGQEGELLAW